MEKRDRFAKKLIREIPEIIGSIRDLNIEEKSSSRDLVTEVDKAVEEHIKNRIKEEFPTDEILGEESFDENKDYKLDSLWIIDPIDGTTNFIKQGQDYCTIISYFFKGEPRLAYIYDITRDILYWSISGKGVYRNSEKIVLKEKLKLNQALISIDISRLYQEDFFEKIVEESFAMRNLGSSGLDGIKVIEGKIGAYLNKKAGPWDFGPFHLMSKEMGIDLLSLEGEELSYTNFSSFILCQKGIYQEIFK